MMDNEEEKKKIVVTGNMAVKFVSILGLISCIGIVAVSLFTGTSVDWTFIIGAAVVCGMGIYLSGYKGRSS